VQSRSLSYQIDYNSDLLKKVIGQLDIIAKSINNPLSTQANELVRSGEHLMERGLYKEAYDDMTAAENKRPVNPLLHLHLAQLHYYVRDEGVPFDLAAAEQHVNFAIRYATSLRDDLGKDGAAVVDLVYRTAAHLALVKGGDLCQSVGQEAGEAELHRAEGLLLHIDQPSPSSQFLHAQVLALLGRTDESCLKVRVLADYIRSWIPRALSEPNLNGIADQVRALSKDLRANPGIHSKDVYEAVSDGREFAGQCASIASEFSSPSADLTIQINEMEHDFEAGAIDAISAENALQGALASAKANTLALIEVSVDELERNKKKEVDDAVWNESRAKDRRIVVKEIAKFLFACVEALCAWYIAFEEDSIEILYVLLGVFFGFILGAVSCQSVVQGGWNRFLYFIFSGPVGAVLLPFFRKIIKYKSYAISGSDADAHLAKAAHLRRQAKISEQRIKKITGIRIALGL